MLLRANHIMITPSSATHYTKISSISAPLFLMLLTKIAGNGSKNKMSRKNRRKVKTMALIGV